MGTIYTCESCSDQFCDDCEPETMCDFCSKSVCPDCDNKVMHSDNRHRVLCSSCLNTVPKPERKGFKMGSKSHEDVVQFSQGSFDLLHNLKNVL